MTTSNVTDNKQPEIIKPLMTKITNDSETTGIEFLEPMYLEPSFAALNGRIIQQKMYRVEIGVGRHYRLEDGRTFKSITTFLDAVMPPNRILTNWRDNKIEELGSVDKMVEFVQATADFGTALHVAVADFCRNGFVDWVEFEAWATDYIIGMKMTGKTSRSALSELTKDFASLIQFIAEYEVKILAVEIPVWSSDGYATLIDLVCEMNAKNYTDKTPPEKRQRIVCGINLKSGKKGFHDSHVFQLVGERAAFNETYSETAGFKLEHMANLAPKNWTGETPTFNFKLQTDYINDGNFQQRFDNFVNTGKLEGVLGKPSKNFTIFEGRTPFGKSAADNMVVLNYDEFTNRKLATLAIESTEK